MNENSLFSKAAKLAACGLLLLSTPGSADDAATWLGRMSHAIDSSSYTGIALRQQRGEIETLRVSRAKIDGVVREYLQSQEGVAMEFIRTGDEVQCVFPAKKAVLLDTWTADSMLFTAIPSDPQRFSGAYTLRVEPSERVAGRDAQVLFVEPADALRFAHRLWLDAETGFPLRTQVIDSDDEVLSEIRFADIRFEPNLALEDFVSDYDTANFRWVKRTKSITEADATIWTSDDLPTGFRQIAAHNEAMRGKDAAMHILYSDGLSTVSVFIEPAGERVGITRSQVGSANSYSMTVDGYRITAVGEVPAATTELIAQSMRKS